MDHYESSPPDPKKGKGKKSDATDGAADGVYPMKPVAGATLAEQPEHRMGDCRRLRGLIQAAANNEQRSKFIRICNEVDEMYDRRPPEDKDALRMDGLAYVTNVDWGGMEFGIDSAIAPEFNLLTMPETFVSIESLYQGPQATMQKRTFEEEDHRLLHGTDWWIAELGKMLIHRKKYGCGIFYFRSPRSWEFRSLHPMNLLTPNNGMNPVEWEWCAVKTEFDITDLLQRAKKVKDEGKTGEKDFLPNGWSPRGIKQAIEQHCKNQQGGNIPNLWEAASWEDTYVKYDLDFAHHNKLRIPGYIAYIREFDGTITEYLLTTNDNVGFLYRSPKAQRLKNMSEAFSMFPHSITAPSLYQVRGFGVKNLPFFDAENMAMNRMVDNGIFSSGVFVDGSPDALFNQQQIQMGTLQRLPEGLQISERQMPFNAQGLLAIQQIIESKRNAAGPATGSNPNTGGNFEKTAKEATMRYQEGSRLQSFDFNYLYTLATPFHRNRVRRSYGPSRMVEGDRGYKEARRALEKMVAKGLTPDFLMQIDYDATEVKRMFGDGDPVKAYMDMMDLQPFVGMFSPEGKRAYLQRLIHVKHGREAANEYLGGPSAGQYEREQKHKAQLENAALETSDSAIDAEGDPFIHMSEHTQLTQAKVQMAYQQFGDSPGDWPKEEAQKVFELISRGMAHVGFNEDAQIAGGHIAALLEDPTQGEQAAQQFQQSWAGFANLRRQIGQSLSERAQSEQQKVEDQKRIPVEDMAKAQKIQTEAQMKAQMMQADLQHKLAMNELEKQSQELKIQEQELRLKSLQQQEPPTDEA